MSQLPPTSPFSRVHAALRRALHLARDLGARDALSQISAAAHARRRAVPQRHEPHHVLVRRLGARHGLPRRDARAAGKAIESERARALTRSPWCIIWDLRVCMRGAFVLAFVCACVRVC
eukprot:4825039-Pleurochrysis_carterae.AAC.2